MPVTRSRRSNQPSVPSKANSTPPPVFDLTMELGILIDPYTDRIVPLGRSRHVRANMAALWKPAILRAPHPYQRACRHHTLPHALHHPNPPHSVVCYIARIIPGIQLQPTPTNILATWNRDPITLPSIHTLHALALVASQLPPAYHNITLQDLIHIADQEKNSYCLAADNNGEMNERTHLQHSDQTQEQWRKWNSAETAQS